MKGEQEASSYTNQMKVYIKKLGYTIQEVADEVGIAPRTFGNYVRGKTPMPRNYRQKVAEVLGCTIEELFESSSENNSSLPPLQGGQDVDRRQFIQFVGTTAFVADVEIPDQWERLSKALAKPSRLDTKTMSHLETVKEGCWQLLPDVAGTASYELRKYVLGHLDTVTTLLREAASTRLRKRLLSNAGELALIIARMSMELRDVGSGNLYYNMAFEVAQETGNHQFQAVILARIALYAMHHGQLDAAIQSTQRAISLSSMASSTTRFWIFAVGAEAQAKANNRAACLQLMDHMEVPQPGNDSYRTTFDVSRFSGYRGACYLSMGQPQEARQALLEALNVLPLSQAHRRSDVLVELAIASIYEREIELACDYAGQALPLAARSPSASRYEYIRNFHQQLAPWPEISIVKNINEQLHYYRIV